MEFYSKLGNILQIQNYVMNSKLFCEINIFKKVQNLQFGDEIFWGWNYGDKFKIMMIFQWLKNRPQIWFIIQFCYKINIWIDSNFRTSHNLRVVVSWIAFITQSHTEMFPEINLSQKLNWMPSLNQFIKMNKDFSGFIKKGGLNWITIQELRIRAALISVFCIRSLAGQSLGLGRLNFFM